MSKYTPWKLRQLRPIGLIQTGGGEKSRRPKRTRRWMLIEKGKPCSLGAPWPQMRVEISMGNNPNNLLFFFASRSCTVTDSVANKSGSFEWDEARDAWTSDRLDV